MTSSNSRRKEQKPWMMHVNADPKYRLGIITNMQGALNSINDYMKAEVFKSFDMKKPTEEVNIDDFATFEVMWVPADELPFLLKHAGSEATEPDDDENNQNGNAPYISNRSATMVFLDKQLCLNGTKTRDDMRLHRHFVDFACNVSVDWIMTNLEPRRAYWVKVLPHYKLANLWINSEYYAEDGDTVKKDPSSDDDEWDDDDD